jgi:protein involved in polysaccharide export with SLBB domain
MKSRKFYLFSYILLCVILRQSSISAQTPTPEIVPAENSSEIAKTDVNLIHFGDLVDVDVIGSIEYDWRGTLDPEGFLDGIDYAENPIYALCRSEEKIAEEVGKAYAKILRDPKVVVKILDRSNRPLSFLYGAIKTPQRFQIRRPIFLNELLVVSGGLTERASGEIQIFRPQKLNCPPETENKSLISGSKGENRGRFVTASQSEATTNYINIKISDLLGGKKEANPRILSGDVVTVLEAESIYVIGGVQNPKQISSRAQITLTRAVAAAGGASKNADIKKVTIYRREAGETKIIEADLENIKVGEAEDLILRAFDIVEVAQTGREKLKFPPVLKIAESNEKKPSNLPLRVID